MADVAAGNIPRTVGIDQLVTLISLTPAQAELVMGDVGRGFKPAAGEPAAA